MDTSSNDRRKKKSVHREYDNPIPSSHITFYGILFILLGFGDLFLHIAALGLSAQELLPDSGRQGAYSLGSCAISCSAGVLLVAAGSYGIYIVRHAQGKPEKKPYVEFMAVSTAALVLLSFQMLAGLILALTLAAVRASDKKTMSVLMILVLEFLSAFPPTTLLIMLIYSSIEIQLEDQDRPAISLRSTPSTQRISSSIYKGPLTPIHFESRPTSEAEKSIEDRDELRDMLDKEWNQEKKSKLKELRAKTAVTTAKAKGRTLKTAMAIDDRFEKVKIKRKRKKRKHKRKKIDNGLFLPNTE